jgi:hypothetical protein
MGLVTTKKMFKWPQAGYAMGLITHRLQDYVAAEEAPVIR